MSAVESRGAPNASAVIEGALEDAIERLRRAEPSARVRASLIEARRLRSLIASWRAIPPPDSTRREMLSRVLEIAAAAGAPARSVPSAPVSGTTARPLPRVRPVPSVPPQEERALLGPGVELVRAGGLPWQPFPNLVGIEIKVLRRDATTGLFAAVVTMQPGTTLPRHRHAAVEELFLLEGEVRIGTFEARAGDYCRCEPRSVHEPTYTEAGCSFLLMGSEDDELLP